MTMHQLTSGLRVNHLTGTPPTPEEEALRAALATLDARDEEWEAALRGLRQPATYISMGDPCPHLTRLDVIRARLNGELDVLDHLESCHA
jgi:hypothetical protein